MRDPDVEDEAGKGGGGKRNEPKERAAAIDSKSAP